MSESDTDTQARRRRREEYETILRIVEHNTGGVDRPQPALAKRAVIVRLARQAGIQHRRARRRIQAAVENDDLLDWHGELARVDEASLKAVVAEEDAADHPRLGLIRRCADLIREVTG